MIKNVVVIGGNAAGMSFAMKFRRSNPEANILVIEKNNYVSFGGCGLPYFVGNEFSDENEMIVKTPEEVIASGIDLKINEEALSINEKSVVTTKGEYHFDKLIIASGARPRKIENTYTLTSLEDGRTLREALLEPGKKVAIVGAGFIGLELYDNINENHDVTIFEAQNSILSGMYDASLVENIFEKINVILNAKVEVSKTETGFLVNGEQFDIVVSAIGFVPNTEFVNLDKLPNGAIITNNKCETSMANVYAIGDCATITNIVDGKPVYIPLATGANKLGRFLADTLSGNTVPYKGTLMSSCLKVLDYELATCGINESYAINNNINHKVKFIADKNQTSYCNGQEDITAKVIYDPSTLRLLGCEMVGKKGVVGRVDAIAIAIQNEMKTNELGYADMCYAPPFSRT